MEAPGIRGKRFPNLLAEVQFSSSSPWLSTRPIEAAASGQADCGPNGARVHPSPPLALRLRLHALVVLLLDIRPTLAQFGDLLSLVPIRPLILRQGGFDARLDCDDGK